MTRKPCHIEIAMPSGPAYYWAAMLAKPKGFTVKDIARASEGVAYETVKRYVWFCVRDGHVVRIGSKQDGYANLAVYAVKTRRNRAPIERVSERKSPLSAREAMWNAIRAMKRFTVAELRVTASTEDRPISTRSALVYVQALRKAGILIVIEEPARANGRDTGRAPRGAAAGLYRINPAHSGPLAPKLCNAGFVFDMNRRVVVGHPIVTEARS